MTYSPPAMSRWMYDQHAEPPTTPISTASKSYVATPYSASPTSGTAMQATSTFTPARYTSRSHRG